MNSGTGLYDDVVEYIENETVFDLKTEVPDVDMESTCFVSYEKGYVLQVRPEIDDVSVEYGMGLANSETESGLNYIRVHDSRGQESIGSLDDVREFLADINPRSDLASD